jgi:hypothetical protein
MLRIGRNAWLEGGLAGVGLLLLASSPSFAQSDWFRPPADIGNARNAPQQQTRPQRQQAPSRQQVAPPPQQRQPQQWHPLFPLFELFRGNDDPPPPRYAVPRRGQDYLPSAGGVGSEPVRPRRAAPVQAEQPSEPRGTVFASIEAARKDNSVKITDVVLVIGDEYATPLAQGLADAFAAERGGIAVIGKAESASGFGPASQFDWRGAVPALASSQEATAIVVFGGSNDLRPITDEAGKAELFDERWREIYGKRLDELLTALKSHGRPVVVVGLPPVDDNKASDRNAKLNELLKEHVEKAGLVFADVWDGFVDENGKFLMSGPAVDGQRRRLRTADGAGFTRAGGRKLAFFVDRSLGKLLNGGAVPTATAAAGASPATGSSLPMLIQLTGAGAAGAAKTLAGGARPGEPARIPDTAASRVLVSGEPLGPVNGRADDFRWTPPGAPPGPAAAAPATGAAPATPAPAPGAAGTATTP